MAQHFQVLVVGGWNAGLSAAALLLLKNSKLRVGIIEPSEKHYYQPAWTLVGGGAFNVKDTERNEVDYIPKGAQWIKGRWSMYQLKREELPRLYWNFILRGRAQG